MTLSFLDASKDIKNYYGQVLQSSKDLKTSACCSSESLPRSAREMMAKIHPEILEKFYGCGSPIPPAISGLHVLDLGCGSGRDVYIMSGLVGQNGSVTGVDMTPEQLAVARRHQEDQSVRFGFTHPNTRFLEGPMEDLAALGIADHSMDLVTSNCVLNLSMDKPKVFAEIFRVLKPGGELYISDIFSGQRIPKGLAQDPVLRGECLAGALYIEDFRRILNHVGCLDYRSVSKRRLTLDDPAIEAKIGMVSFYSMTVRAFRLENLEDLCEDYGQMATYLGTLPEHLHAFDLDDHHHFISGKPTPVCGNTAAMLEETRYKKHFRITGDRKTHFGPFPCTPSTVPSGTGCC